MVTPQRLVGGAAKACRSGMAGRESRTAFLRRKGELEAGLELAGAS